MYGYDIHGVLYLSCEIHDPWDIGYIFIYIKKENVSDIYHHRPRYVQLVSGELKTCCIDTNYVYLLTLFYVITFETSLGFDTVYNVFK